MALAGFRRLYLVGDSLTQQGFQTSGWTGIVADTYIRRYDVVNRGFSGYTTDYVKRILPSLLHRDNVKPGSNVAAVTILLGSNDAVLPEHDKRNVPLDEYTENLEALSGMLKEAGISPKQQIFIGVPPISEEKWRAHTESQGKEMNLSDAQTRQYADACRAVAQSLGTSYIELYQTMMSLENFPDLLSDGLHLSPEGNQFLAEKVCKTLDNILPKTDFVYPVWSDIDPTNPDIALKEWCKV